MWVEMCHVRNNKWSLVSGMERAALIYSKAHICVFYMSMIEYKSYILVVGGFVSCQYSVGGAALHYSPFLTNRPSIDEPLPIDFQLSPFPHCTVTFQLI